MRRKVCPMKRHWWFSSERATESVEKTLPAWCGSGFLQPHEIKGLIAEMLVLELLIRDGERDVHETVSGWIGPLGADQDFMYSTGPLK